MPLREFSLYARRWLFLVAFSLSMSACSDGNSNTDTGSPQPPVSQQDVIEALFLGSGPLSAGACPSIGRWSGFPRQTTVTVTVSTTVAADKRDAIRAALDEVAVATNGDIQTRFRITDDPNPLPGLDEVTSTTHISPSSQGCASDIGCTIPIFFTPGVLHASRAVQPEFQTVQAYVHDVIGHGVLGLCHIDGNLIGGPGLSLMSGGPGVTSDQIADAPTNLDIEATMRVYASALQLGALRSDFVAAGLVAP